MGTLCRIMLTYTHKEAEAMGYVSITTPFEHSEKEMFERTLEQMKGTDYLVVLDRLKRPEIYRKRGEVRNEA